MTTPVGVAETLERLAVGWRCSVGVGLAVVGQRVVKVGSSGGGCGRMVGDALGCCGVEVPDHVEGGLKVLLVGTAAV